MAAIDKGSSKKKVFFLLAGVIFVCAAVACYYFYFDRNVDKGRIVAEVNGIRIYELDLEQRIAAFTGDTKVTIEEVPQNMLKAMVLEVVVNKDIDKEARKLGYQNRSDIKTLTNSFKQSLMREEYLDDKIYSRISDNEVLAEYTKISEDLRNKQERKIRHILVESQEQIDNIKRRLARGESFERLAKEESIDAVSSENGGDIGYVLKDELVPEFGDLAFLIKVGEISKPVRTQFGWHIIRVDDERPAKILPLEEVKEDIKQTLRQRAMQEYLSHLTDGKDVIFKIKLKELRGNEVTNDDTVENSVDDNGVLPTDSNPTHGTPQKSDNTGDSVFQSSVKHAAA